MQRERHGDSTFAIEDRDGNDDGRKKRRYQRKTETWEGRRANVVCYFMGRIKEKEKTKGKYFKKNEFVYQLISCSINESDRFKINIIYLSFVTN